MTILLVNLSNEISLACFQMSFSLNTWLCIDLFLIIRKPLVIRDTRVKWYILSSLLYGIFALIMREIRTKDLDN